ncbi:MAG: transcription-repair coupling factor [Acidiferrobacterales bacterium]
MQKSLTARQRTPLSPLHPTLPRNTGEPFNWSRLYGSSRGLAIARTAAEHRGPLLVITADARSAQQLEDEIRFYASPDAKLSVVTFPDWECLPYDVLSPHPDIISRRLLTLYQLPHWEQGIVLATVPTLMHRLPPSDYVSRYSFVLNTKDVLKLEAFREQLVRSGYHSVSQVMEPGEFAVRGGLIDLFPMGSATPYRIDLFGDEIESLREFNPGTQRSGQKLNGIQLLPAREFPLTPSAIQFFRRQFRARFEGDPQKVALYRDVSRGVSPAGLEYYLPLFFASIAAFFDYLPAQTLCIIDANTPQAARDFAREAEERYLERCHDRSRPILAPHELFLTDEELADGLQKYRQIRLLQFKADEERHLSAANHQAANMITFDTEVPPSLSVDYKAQAPYRVLLDYLRRFPGRILLVAETIGRRETLRGLLQDNELEPRTVESWQTFHAGDTKLGLTVARLEKGLLLPQPAIAVITEPQFYGERAAQRRRRVRVAQDPEAVIRSLAELQVGDPVVHEDHGVGRYLGLQILDVGDGPTEFLALEYAGGDKLYIPVVALHLITRYTGTDPEHAPLHRLGSDAWEKAKRRAREKAHDIAAELLEIYAVREARPGHIFPPRDGEYTAFANAFPFEETPDQARAIDEVLVDMESQKLMDRLVCGDVGFGKTEVAMRATFLAVQGQMQVALLVPTTLLAQQHFQNFSDRFADLPVRIELLSRFRTKAQQADVVAGLANGGVDLVIGTHRILQSDIRFKKLGLMIIDEEHRFGVRQKERLKKLRREVDVLTLTATPIPRTLNMGLAGLRDISMIATAPEERLSIKTLVSEWNRALIREACLREIRRGGQVYYLHNEVRTIERAVRQMQELVPEAEIHMAHGQMPERALERIMLDFYHQRFNVLVCTTIIESGIDIPTANTIVIQRADKFGLAQLHQLRGRVGRSHHRAYAYLLIPPRGSMTAAARKRLEAIVSLEDLGAGFTLAAHDLEIRGAGELLGEAQSGQIDEVGFALYSELLSRAVQSLQAGQEFGQEEPIHSGTEINVHAPALLPDDYLPDVHMRLILYKRIANASTLAALDGLREEVIDRFGLLPDAAKLLFAVTALKIQATPLGIRKIDAGPRGARIGFHQQPNIDPTSIIHLMQSAPGTYKLDGPDRLRIVAEMPDVDMRVNALRRLFDALSPAGEVADSE